MLELGMICTTFCIRRVLRQLEQAIVIDILIIVVLLLLCGQEYES